MNNNSSGTVIKGTKDGLTVFLDQEADFKALLVDLEKKLATNDSFLIGAHVIVDPGERKLSKGEVMELRNLLPSYGLIVKEILPVSEGKRVRGQREKILQIANNLYEVGERPVESPQHKKEYRDLDVTTFGGSSASPHEEYWGDENTLLIQRTVRSGQTIEYPGHLVVLGDVNPGAEIIAGGNIIVMGALRGVAHAGASGNEQSVVVALRLQPTQLRISNHITRPPDGDTDAPVLPEIARIRDGMVTIERYLPHGDRNLRTS